METQVLIIGAGLTGLGLARDLALRGVHCVVVEKSNINAGASGANHGLLHSGARYVGVDPSSARDCLDESRLLKRLAPACIEETGGFYVAVEGDDERYVADFPGYCEKIGLEVRPVTCRDALDAEPALTEKIMAVYAVDEASVNPFKLALDNMAHAEALSAKILTHTRVVQVEVSAGRIASVRLQHLGSGRETVIRADQVVNASGAWAGRVAALAGVDLPVVLSQGTLLVTQMRVAQRVISRLRAPSDGDLIVPGGTVSLTGTTSLRVQGLDGIRATFPEVDFLVAEGAKVVPELADMRFVRAFTGVRALLAHDRSLNDRDISRGFAVVDHERDGLANFASVFGGKLTTYRLMAEKTADLVCERLGVAAPCRTRIEPLPACEEGRWADPRMERRRWIRSHDPDDMLLCECEMVPQSAVDLVMDHLAGRGEKLDFGALALRSRMGKGSCQGAFCAFRICGLLYRSGAVAGEEGLHQLRTFLQERWHGLRPVLWGRQMVQEQLQEAIHCGLFGLELE